MFLPIASAMSARISLLERSGALDLRLRLLFRDVSAWLRYEITEPARAQQLRDAAERLEPDLGKNSNWYDLVLANLLARLRDFIDLRQDVRLLQQFSAGWACVGNAFRLQLHGQSPVHPAS
jgi:hypothetical protein